MTNHELFHLPNITSIKEFRDEYTETVQKKPNRKKIEIKVLALLNLLSSTRYISELCKTDNFEKLTDTSASLYAMKIKMGSSCNIRIIFSYERNGSILLLLFEEKAGKRKTDYSRVIPIAVERLKATKGGKSWQK